MKHTSMALEYLQIDETDRSGRIIWDAVRLANTLMHADNPNHSHRRAIQTENGPATITVARQERWPSAGRVILGAIFEPATNTLTVESHSSISGKVCSISEFISSVPHSVGFRPALVYTSRQCTRWPENNFEQIITETAEGADGYGLYVPEEPKVRSRAYDVVNAFGEEQHTFQYEPLEAAMRRIVDVAALVS